MGVTNRDLVTRQEIRASAEAGMTLIEMLIALVVIAIGISAIVAGLSSGILAINRGHLASTAGSLADQKMESYRQGSFASLPTGTLAATYPVGPDGHTYWMQVAGAWTCALGTYSAGPPANCTGSTPASRPVINVSITVRDCTPQPACTSPTTTLFTEASTFDAATG